MAKKEFHESGMQLRGPDVEKIKCKDCIFRAEDRFGGAVKGATLAICDCFKDKPMDILWKDADCIYYEKED